MVAMSAIPEIKQWYLLDYNIWPNNMAEIQVLEIEILTVINVFLKPLIDCIPVSSLSAHGWDTGHKHTMIMLIFMKTFLNSQFSIQSSVVRITCQYW